LLDGEEKEEGEKYYCLNGGARKVVWWIIGGMRRLEALGRKEEGGRKKTFSAGTKNVFAGKGRIFRFTISKGKKEGRYHCH